MESMEDALNEEQPETENKHYYLGSYIGVDEQSHMVDYSHIPHLTRYYALGIRIPLNIFYQYSIEDIEYY